MGGGKDEGERVKATHATYRQSNNKQGTAAFQVIQKGGLYVLILKYMY